MALPHGAAGHLLRRRHADGATLAAAHLAHGGVVVLDGLLTDEELAAARASIAELKATPGALHLNPKAQIGNLDVRTDSVCYVRDRNSGTETPAGHAARQAVFSEGLLHCHRLLRGIASDLEGQADHGALAANQRLLVPEWTQLAVYGDGGAFYRSHVDGLAFPHAYWLLGPFGLLLFWRWGALRRRAVTAILYLNEPMPWDPGWGGALRCHAPTVAIDQQGVRQLPQTADSCNEILPQGGRLVLFDSRTVEHEVVPTQHERWALSFWIHS